MRRLARDERGAGCTDEVLTHEEVLAAGAEAGPRLARVIRDSSRFLAGPEARTRREATLSRECGAAAHMDDGRTEPGSMSRIAPRAGSAYELTGSSRPAARAAAAFSAHASSTRSLWGRIGQCPSRLPISSQ